MTRSPIAQNPKLGATPPLYEIFWGKGDAGKALYREALEIIARKYPSPAKPVKPPPAPRKPTLASALKQAAKAGKSVKGAEVYPDRVVLQFGEPTAEASANELDEWIANDARASERH